MSSTSYQDLMMLPYDALYRRWFDNVAELACDRKWDVFISAYNDTERVRAVFESVCAEKKFWVIHSEYDFPASELPTGSNVFARPDVQREDEFITAFLEILPPLSGLKIGLDITGFMRPHMSYLLRVLDDLGVGEVDVLYTEPRQYAKREDTQFAQGDVSHVRPVAGFEGIHEQSNGREEDLLIVAVGYEHQLIRHVAAAKNSARKVELVGFPSLQADFYQESRLNVYKAAEALSAANENDPLFAPAGDPFTTASVISDYITSARKHRVKNIYLCPLSSHPQALGFALYYIYEGMSQPISLLYPFASKYARDAAIGVARIWNYRVEFPAR